MDLHAPKLPIVWETPLEIPIFNMPKERDVVAARALGARAGDGGVRIAARARCCGSPRPPGKRATSGSLICCRRLHDLGMKPPFQSQRLWAFFDGAYRSRVDLDYFAERWRKAGIGALHVAGWHYCEQNRNPTNTCAG